MEFAFQLNQLNSIYSNLKENCNLGDKENRIKFLFGVKEELKKVLSSVAPMSKVALICTENTFNRSGLEIYNFIKSTGAKPVNYLISEEDDLSVDNLCGMFNMAEDIRAVIVLDCALSHFAYYFASIQKVPCIVVLNKLFARGLLDSKLIIKNEQTLDVFTADCERYIIIDGEIEYKEQDKINAFSYLVSNMISLVDYRFYSVITRTQPNKKAYSLARTCILNGVSFIKNSLSDEELLFNILCLELANYFTDGKLITFSSPSIAEFLLNGKMCVDGVAMLFASSVIASAYKEWTKQEKAQEDFAPEYGNRAKELNNLCGVSIEEVLKNYKAERNRFVARKAQIKELKLKLKEEVVSIERVLTLACEFLHKKGAKTEYDVDKFYKSIKLSGDLPFSINGMSLIRDEGVIKEKE
jgi:hypothetical protein